MPSPNRTASPVPVRADDGGPVAIRPELLAAVEMMIDSVPDGGGDAFDNIIGVILAASDARDLDAPWRTAGLGELVNQRIVLTAIRKLASDYAGGLPFFLVCDGAYLDSGEVFSVTTGAVSVVVQLAKAWQLGAFPVRCIPRESASSTPGRRPSLHLEMIP